MNVDRLESKQFFAEAATELRAKAVAGLEVYSTVREEDHPHSTDRTILEEFHARLHLLDELHSRLSYMMGEVETLLIRKS